MLPPASTPARFRPAGPPPPTPAAVLTPEQHRSYSLRAVALRLLQANAELTRALEQLLHSLEIQGDAI